MKKKIGMIFIGAIRESLYEIKNNIRALKDCFLDYEVDIIFSTWYPKEGQYDHYGINYIYDYDMDELMSEISGIIDISILLEQRDMDKYPKCKDASPPLFLYNLIEVSKYLIDKGLLYDYIVRSRHDNFLQIKHVENYLNNNTYVPPAYHLPNNKYDINQTSGHFFITHYNNFIKLSSIKEEDIIDLCGKSINCEEIDAYVLNSISNLEFMEDMDIIKFKNKNLEERKFKW